MEKKKEVKIERVLGKTRNIETTHQNNAKVFVPKQKICAVSNNSKIKQRLVLSLLLFQVLGNGNYDTKEGCK
jgi:hypothetical protein